MKIKINEKIYYLCEIQYTDKFNNIFSERYINAILDPQECFIFVINGECGNRRGRVAQIYLLSNLPFTGNFLYSSRNSRPVFTKIPHTKINFYFNFIHSITVYGFSRGLEQEEISPISIENKKYAIKKALTRGCLRDEIIKQWNL